MIAAAAIHPGAMPDAPIAWATVALLGLASGLLALDDTALVQSWLSTPLAAAVVAGWIAGDVTAGLAVGVPLQLVLAANLPVGQTYTGDSATAVVGIVGGAVAGGWRLVPDAAAGGPEAWGPLGWCLLGAALASLAGHPLVQAERRAHVLWMLEGHRTLRDGSLTRIERIHARCLLATFLRGVVFGVLFVLAAARLWLPAYELLPAGLQSACGLMPLLVPALGLGMMAERYGFRASWPWLAAGLAAAALLEVVA